MKGNATSQMFAPGPGAYSISPEKTLKAAPSWKIGTASRDDRENAIKRANMPPPGTHNPNFDSVANKSAAWGFGTSTRPALAQTKNTPGAGSYDLPSKMIEGPKFVMG